MNAAPVASEQSVVTNEDAAKKITLTATDAENNPLTYKVSALPTGGTLYKGDATNPANQTEANKVVVNTALPGAEVTYVPNANYNNNSQNYDTFSLVANDGTTDSVAATVTITVTAVNDAPSFTKGADQSVAEDSGAKTVAGFATGISPGPADESAQAVSFAVTNDNNALFSAQPSISPDGTLTYTPAADTSGSATVTVKATDSGPSGASNDNESYEQTFTITLTAVDDTPPSAKAKCTINGTKRGETLTGTPGNDVICGKGGADTINSLGGDDVLVGDKSVDRMSGGTGNDRLLGNGGNDTLVGGTGEDALDGRDGSGGDELDGESGKDACQSDAGDTARNC